MNERELILNAFYRHRFTIRGRRIDIYPPESFNEETTLHFECTHDEYRGSAASYLSQVDSRICTIPDLIKLDSAGMPFSYASPIDALQIFDNVTNLLRIIKEEIDKRLYVPSGVLDMDFVRELEGYRERLFHVAYDHLIDRDVGMFRSTEKDEEPTLINLFADPTVPVVEDIPEIAYEPIIPAKYLRG